MRRRIKKEPPQKKEAKNTVFFLRKYCVKGCFNHPIILFSQFWMCFLLCICLTIITMHTKMPPPTDPKRLWDFRGEKKEKKNIMIWLKTITCRHTSTFLTKKKLWRVWWCGIKLPDEAFEQAEKNADKCELVLHCGIYPNILHIAISIQPICTNEKCVGLGYWKCGAYRYNAMTVNNYSTQCAQHVHRGKEKRARPVVRLAGVHSAPPLAQGWWRSVNNSIWVALFHR